MAHVSLAVWRRQVLDRSRQLGMALCTAMLLGLLASAVSSRTPAPARATTSAEYYADPKEAAFLSLLNT